MRSTAPAAVVAVLVAGATFVLSAQAPICTDCVWGRYWKVPTAGCHDTSVTCFPETDYLPKDTTIGVAFSGGGTRAATMALGQLRGLRELDLLRHVRYVSAISGGSWAAVPYVYTKSPLDDFLGPFEDYSTLATLPEKDARVEAVVTRAHGELGRAIVNSALTAGSVQEVAGDLANTFSDRLGDRLWLAVKAGINRARREPERLDKTYSRLIGGIFVDPLIDTGTSASTRLFSWNAATVQDTSQVSEGKLGADFVVAGPGRPFLIAGGTVIVARRDYDYPMLMPVEYTPMYVGIRHRFSDRYGGYYVPSWAYDTTLIDAVDAARGLIRVRREPKRSFTLGDVVGSSGAAPQLALVLGTFVPDSFRERIQRASAVFPAFRHVTLNTPPTRTIVSEQIGHGDGGFGDNLGIMPLLARGVKRIVVFNNSVTHEVENNDDFKSLFFPVGPPGSGGNKTLNVAFWCNDRNETGCTAADKDTYYSDLIAKLVARREAKQPLAYCGGPYKLRRNDQFDVDPVEGGVRICWFYTSPAAEWEGSLNPRLLRMVRNQDATKEGKHFENFPWLATFGQNKTNVIKLTTPQVNLLSNLTGWSVVHEGQALRSALLP